MASIQHRQLWYYKQLSWTKEPSCCLLCLQCIGARRLNMLQRLLDGLVRQNCNQQVDSLITLFAKSPYRQNTITLYCSGFSQHVKEIYRGLYCSIRKYWTKPMLNYKVLKHFHERCAKFTAAIMTEIRRPVQDMSLQALRMWSRWARICSTEGWSLSSGCFTTGTCWTLLMQPNITIM